MTIGESLPNKKESIEDASSVFQTQVCPVIHTVADKKVNQPIHAKKYVPTNVKPTPLQKPGENDMDMFSYTEIVDCPVVETFPERIGKWFGPLNLVPFFTAIRALMGSVKVFREKAAMFPNDSCIRCNIGRDCVILVGHTPVHWFLTQPLENVDRDPFIKAIGPFQIGHYYLGKSVPCLLAAESDGHSKIRKLHASIFKNRLADLDYAVESTFTYRLNQLIDGVAKNPKFINFADSGNFLAGYFMTFWMFGVEPPSTQILVEWGPKCLSIPSTDNWLGRFLGQLLGEVMLTLDGSHRRHDSLIGLIRNSRYYKEYENMAKDCGVELQDFDKSLVFTTFLSGNFGVCLPFSSVVAALGEQLGSLSELRAEIGMDELTLESVSDPKKYPLLDSVFWECARAFIRGQIHPRKAKKDLLIPGGNGKAYRAKKNDYLIAYFPIANRDPSVFDNPDRFNPRRFYDNPELKKHCFAFGVPYEFDPQQAEWGCPIYPLGFGTQLLKMFIGKWIQRVDWSLTQPSQFVGDTIGEYTPVNNSYGKLQYRQEYLDWLSQCQKKKSN